MFPSPLAVTFLVVDVFEQLDISYLISSSLASAVHGVVRATMDVDLFAEMRPEQIAPFTGALKGQFHVDELMIADAIAHQGSFNLVHLESIFKVDIFVRKDRPFDRSEFARRAAQPLSSESPRRAYIASAEDILLAKLE